MHSILASLTCSRVSAKANRELPETNELSLTRIYRKRKTAVTCNASSIGDIFISVRRTEHNGQRGEGPDWYEFVRMKGAYRKSGLWIGNTEKPASCLYLLIYLERIHYFIQHRFQLPPYSIPPCIFTALLSKFQHFPPKHPPNSLNSVQRTS